MKKFLYILGIVGTALLSACSSDDLMTVLSPEEERTLVVEASQDSDVPITLGSVASVRSGMTRTPIESGGDFSTPTGANAPCLGVFCLASGKQASAPSSASGNWNDALATWLKNVPAKVATGDVTFLDPTTLDHETPTSRVLYYPYGNWYYYNFYAYYPRITDDEAISVGSNSVIVNYEIDGRQDIIWGKTTAPDQAYCAKYCREHPAATPQFAFEHKLAQLKFVVHSENDVKLESLVLNACYKLSLYVAGDSEGTLSVNDPSTMGIPVWTSADKNPFDLDGDAEIQPILVSGGSDTEIGYMLVPPSTTSYSVFVKFEGSAVQSVNIGPVEAGKKYTFTLNKN